MNTAARLALVFALICPPFAARSATPAADFEAALSRGDTAGVEAALRRGAPRTGPVAGDAMMRAVIGKSAEMLDALVRGGVPIDQTDKHGGTALMYACDKGNAALVAHLLKRGANPSFIGNPDSEEPNLALVAAVESHSIEIVDMLLKAAADPNGVDSFPVHEANQWADPAIYKLLLDAGGKPWPDHPAVHFEIPGAREAAAALQAGKPVASVTALGLTELIPATDVPRRAVAPGGACRLAIIADESTSAAADLLAAELSGVPGIELIERQEIARILSEQKLSGQFATEAANGVKIGNLLGANALALVRTQKLAAGEVVESRLVRVNPGLVLDTAFRPAPLTDAAAWARDTAQRTQQQLSKSLSKDAIALSLLPLRSTVGGAAGRELEQMLAMLLVDRLAHQSGFFLLERKALEQVVEEQELSTAPVDRFWKGSYVIDGGIESPPNGQGKLTLSLRLQPEGKGEAVAVSVGGTSDALPRLADEALARINAALMGRPIAQTAAPQEEAERYMAEARVAEQFESTRLGMEAAATAWALGLRTPEVRRLRVRMTAQMISRSAQGVRARVEKLTKLTKPPAILRDLLNHPFRGPDCPSAEEFLGWIGDCLALLEQEGQSARGGEADAIEALQSGTSVQHALTWTLQFFDTAAMRLRYAERLGALKVRNRALYPALLKVGIERAPGSPELVSFAKAVANGAPLWTDTTAEWQQVLLNILDLRFGTRDVLSRAELREFFPVLLTQLGIYTAPLADNARAWQGLSKKLHSREAPEDRLLACSIELRTRWKQPPEQEAWSQFSLTLLDELMPLFRELPETLRCYLSLVDLYSPGANPLINGEKVQRGLSPYKPIYRDFRLRVLVTLCGVVSDLRWLDMLYRDHESYSADQLLAANRAIESYVARKLGSKAFDKIADYESVFYGTLPKAVAGEALPPIVVSAFWSPGKDESGQPFGTVISTLTRLDNEVWVYAETRTDVNEDPSRAIFRVELPSLRAQRIDLPELPSSRISANQQREEPSLLVTPAFVHVAMPEVGLATYDTKKRKWGVDRTINPLSRRFSVPGEIPSGSGDTLDGGDEGNRLVSAGGKVYLLASQEKSFAFLRLDPDGSHPEIIASTRRKPAVTPLDDPTLCLGRLRVLETGEVEVSVKTAEEPATDPGSNKLVVRIIRHAFSPKAGTWRVSQPWHDWSNPEVYVPTLHGFNRLGAVGKSLNAGPTALRGELHLGSFKDERRRIPIEFALPRVLEKSQGSTAYLVPASYGWTPAGYLFPTRLTFDGFWFLSQVEFDNYLRDHPDAASLVAQQQPPSQ